MALTVRVFRTYPRHRWLGCDIALDEIVLLESVHGLAPSLQGSRGRGNIPSQLAHADADGHGPAGPSTAPGEGEELASGQWNKRKGQIKSLKTANSTDFITKTGEDAVWRGCCSLDSARSRPILARTLRNVV